MKYKVLKPLIYGGKVKETGEILENITSDVRERMLERELIEEYNITGEAAAETIQKAQTPDISKKDESVTDNSTTEDIEIVKYSETELKAFEKPKLLDVAKELRLTVPANIGTDKLIVKILEEYEVIEKEEQEQE